MHNYYFRSSLSLCREISLNYNDGTVKPAKVKALSKVITFKGTYFLRDDAIGSTYYKQVTGEDLSNIEIQPEHSHDF